MPILDPILQFNLSIITNGETKNDLNIFLCQLSKISLPTYQLHLHNY